jgi:polar amino acid transport system substrate-binding protein
MFFIGGHLAPGSWNNQRMRHTLFVLLAVLVAATVTAQSPASVLAPTGSLRATFLGMNPVQGRVDPQTGVATGLVPDLIKELAAKLGVPYRILPAPDAAGVIGALKSGAADIGFLAYDETRAREVEFGAPFAVMFNSYVVRADSALQKSADVDRAGLTVAAVRGQTQELFVSSHMKNARVRVFPAMPPPAVVEMLLTGGEVDAFAVNRQRALDAASGAPGRLRALPDSFMEVEQSLIVNTGERAKLDALARFVDEMRASGFIKAAIDRAKVAGVDVAPARSR